MLINRPERYHDESISSYLYRLARANYRPLGVLLASFGITRAEWLRNMISEDKLIHIADHLVQDKNILHQGTYFVYRELLDENSDLHLLKNRMKFCPDCYREDAYHRMMWGLKPITICLQHGTRLIDACPSCEKPIEMEQFMCGFCKCCDFYYKQTKSISIPFDSIEFELQSEFHGGLFQNGIMFRNIGGLNVKQYLRLAYHSFHLLEELPSFLDYSKKHIRIFHNRRGGIQQNELLAEAYNHVFWMYHDFPCRFQRVLFEFLKKPRKKLYLQKKTYEVLFQEEGFSLIKNEYEQFWINELENGTVRRDLSIFKKNHDLLLRKKYLRKEEIKQLTGISYPKLESLCKSGQIDIISRQKGKTKQHFIDKDTFARLHEERQFYINKREAAQLLGIQRNSIYQLLKEGLINEVHTAFSQIKLIRLDEVLMLLEKSRGVFYIKVKGLSFQQVLIKYSVNGLTISKLLKFIHDNFLHPQLAVLNGNLSNTWFWEKEIQRCIEILKSDKQITDGMYMQDVMQYLKIGEKKMKRIVESGQLIPDRVIVWKDGRKRYLFSKRKVADFKQSISSRTAH
ncbi:TniQ family protein [Paenibacillus sp. FSL H8-0537]|uniref:TniQ family protein n=1 Tax=Paenibacillus sp. FSL H8-0537 TaxID=2921399 RepID=UPI003101B21C